MLIVYRTLTQNTIRMATDSHPAWSLNHAPPPPLCPRRRYHVRKHPALLEECTVNVSLEKDFPEVTGHVLLCGEISSIYQFVRTMRVKNMGPYRPLIILYPSMPRPIWNKIRNFPKIYFCDGSPLESSDLLRAGIRTASKAVVLASTADASASDNLDDEALVDANSIFLRIV